MEQDKDVIYLSNFLRCMCAVLSRVRFMLFFTYIIVLTYVILYELRWIFQQKMVDPVSCELDFWIATRQRLQRAPTFLAFRYFNLINKLYVFIYLIGEMMPILTVLSLMSLFVSIWPCWRSCLLRVDVKVTTSDNY